jgi:hypothetical protein
MGKGLSQDTILTLNKEGTGSIDLHKNALLKAGINPDGGSSVHNIIKSRMRNKVSGVNAEDSNDMYDKILKLRKSGLLKDMLKKAGINKNYLSESMGGMVGSGPIAPMGGAGSSNKASKKPKTILIKNKYATATLSEFNKNHKGK